MSLSGQYLLCLFCFFGRKGGYGGWGQDKENQENFKEADRWEETHCYLLNGTERSLLIDTGLGICNISEVIEKLTDKPVIAIATHIHWDHIGGHKYYPDFYAHEAELQWLNGGFPQPLEKIKEYVTDRCDLPRD